MLIVVLDPGLPRSHQIRRAKGLVPKGTRIYWGYPPVNTSSFNTRNGVKCTLKELIQRYKVVHVTFPPHKEAVRI